MMHPSNASTNGTHHRVGTIDVPFEKARKPDFGACDGYLDLVFDARDLVNQGLVVREQMIPRPIEGFGSRPRMSNGHYRP